MTKQIVTIMLAAMLLAACGDKGQQLKERAAELCQYIPDHELKAESKAFMTTDFYAVLNRLMILMQWRRFRQTLRGLSEYEQQSGGS